MTYTITPKGGGVGFGKIRIICSHATGALRDIQKTAARETRQDAQGHPTGIFWENICSEDNFRTRIFGTFVVKFLACLTLLGFSNI